VADGKTHFRCGLGALLTLPPVLGGLAWLCFGSADAALTVAVSSAAGATGGLFFTADMDLQHTTEPEHYLQRLPLVGKPLKFVSQGYSVWFHTHRGVSHRWLRGSLTRWLYLLTCYVWLFVLPMTGALYVLDFDPAQFAEASLALIGVLPGAGFLLAWLAQDLIHYALDDLPLSLAML
jgi:uncharacterized metal-binding protein